VEWEQQTLQSLQPLQKFDIKFGLLLRGCRGTIFNQTKYFSVSSVNCDKLEKKGDKKEKEGIVKRFKQMAKDYWYVLIPVHICTSVVWFGGFYLMAKSGVDIISVLETLRVPDSIIAKLEGSDAGYYALSYACYKVATPVRYTVTVGGTTITIAKLKDLGYLKTTKEMATTIKNKQEDMTELYNTKREDVKDKIEDMSDMYQKQRENVRDKFEDMKEKYDDKRSNVQNRIETMKDKYEGRKDGVREEWAKAKRRYLASKRRR